MAGMKKAAEQANQTGNKIKESLDGVKEVAVGLGELFAIDWFKEKVDQALEFSEAIKKVEEATGASAKTIQVWNYAASQVGVTTEESNKGLEKFTKNLGDAANGNQELGKVFKTLGVSSTDVNVAIKQTADGISKLPTKAQQAAETVKLFGKTAQGLVPILSEGSEGLDEAAKSAENLGVILSDSTVNGAVEAEHKMSALKMVINAEWANVIGQNASAIANLASELINVAAAAGKAFAAMNVRSDMAILQHPEAVAFEAKITQGLGMKAKAPAQQQDEAIHRLLKTQEGRDALLDANRDAINNLTANGVSMRSNDPRMQMLMVERKGIRATHDPEFEVPKAAPGAGKLPPLKGPKAKKEKKGPVDRTESIEASFERSLSSAEQNDFGAQIALTTDPTKKADLETKALGLRTGDKTKELQAELGAGKFGDKNSELAKSREKQLDTLNLETASFEKELIDQEKTEQIAKDALSIRLSDLSNQSDLLKGSQSLARTAKDRGVIALKLLDNDFEAQKLQLEAIEASKTSTDAEKKIAAARLAMLPALKAQAVEQSKKENQGPMAAYLDAIPKTAGEINEQLQKVETDGLDNLQSGLMGIIDGTKSVKDAFGDLVGSVLQGLEKIVLQQLIIKPLGDLLTGGSDGGSGGGILGSILGSVLGHRANGGMTQPGTYEVGERGPELVSIGANANVSTNNTLRGMGAANDNSGGHSFNFAPGSIVSNDPERVRAMVVQGIASAMPITTRQSTDATYKRLARATL